MTGHWSSYGAHLDRVAADGAAVVFRHTRYSIPAALTANGVAYTVRSTDDGRLVYVIAGHEYTPGDAIDKFDTLGLSPYSPNYRKGN